MSTAERMILTSSLGAMLGPLLDAWAVPKADQTALLAWIIAGIPVAYHAIYHVGTVWGPRVMNRFFPPVPSLPEHPAEKP